MLIFALSFRLKFALQGNNLEGMITTDTEREQLQRQKQFNQ